MKEKVVKLVAEIETGIAYPSYLEASFIVKRKGCAGFRVRLVDTVLLKDIDTNKIKLIQHMSIKKAFSSGLSIKQINQIMDKHKKLKRMFVEETIYTPQSIFSQKEIFESLKLDSQGCEIGCIIGALIACLLEVTKYVKDS